MCSLEGGQPDLEVLCVHCLREVLLLNAAGTRSAEKSREPLQQILHGSLLNGCGVPRRTTGRVRHQRFAQWQALPQEPLAAQAQAAPQEQFAAQAQAVVVAGWRQPQVQDSPGHAAQPQETGWLDGFMVTFLGGSTTGCRR